MIGALLRLFALLALVAMPFGMAVAPALAQPPAASADGHCADRGQPADDPAAGPMHCTACAALPAISGPGPAQAQLPPVPRRLALVDAFSGIEPEIATPPPKGS